ncbi:hypothetical protein BC962_1758 [Gillisia mitskevichiae]|uniref:Uncharacterized protein n=1 Tax=Gillisia mitskevichiae TaxID=270921 RepID=A0A495PU62_9FLAO|nr:hypothetical protein [Gillisia mitskevichiae]RKS53506.1 hypothetical protein BC962_1758 [Gillisia mitskevichiae]
MELEGLKKRCFFEKKKAISKEYELLEDLVQELQSRELPPEVVVDLNEEIFRLNAVIDNHLKLYFYIKLVKKKVLKKLIKDLEIVPKNYYRNLWLALGMCVFGLPLGIVLSTILDNISAIAMGLPIGLAIGVFVGSEMDKRAQENNRQLELEIN